MTDPAVPQEVREFLAPRGATGGPHDHVIVARAGIDRYSETWRVLAGWARAEIEKHRSALETAGLAQPESDVLRGQILSLRDLLDIGNTDRSGMGR